MTDRPGNGPDEGAEFGWLYGKKGAGAGQNPPPPPPPDDRPDATQVLPVQQRPGASGPGYGQPTPPPARQPGPVPPPRGPQPPPSQPGRSGGGFWARRLRRPGFYVKTFFLLLVLWLVYTIAVPFIAWRSVDKIDYEPDGDRPAEQDGTSYLLVGSDSRAGLTEEQREELATGNPKSQLTDTIMILHTGSGPTTLVSIPRDTEPGGDYGITKINAAYANGGAKLLTRIIEQETGIRIDGYVEIGLGGVAGVVDAVGGIEVCPKQNIKDRQAGLDIKKGCQEVDGATALGYSRSRKKSPLGDLARVQRQREVIAAIGSKVRSPWTVVNPIRWWKLNNAVPDFFAFGEGMSTLDAGRWALAMSATSSGEAKTCTVPVTDGSATQWDRDRADPLFEAIQDDETDKITKEQCTPAGIVGAE